MSKIENPLTGRKITVGGQVYDDLIRRGYYQDGNVMRRASGMTSPRRSPRASSYDPKWNYDGYNAYDPKWTNQDVYDPNWKYDGYNSYNAYDASWDAYSELPPYLQRREETYKSPEEGRGSATRGWRVESPRKGRERHQLHSGCGGKCFLLPEEEKFPICAKCKGDRCSCKPDCKAIKSAKIRSHQWKYTELYDKINKLEAEYCGNK